MNEQRLFSSYIRGLLKQWYFTVTLVIGAIDIFVRPFFDIPIPWWIFLGLFGLAFILANYQLYRQTQHQIDQLQQEHKQQLTQAQTQINDLRNREPRLDIHFEDTGTKRTVIKIHKFPDPVNVELLVQQEARELERAYPDPDSDNKEETRSEGAPPGVATAAFEAIQRVEAQLRGPLKSKKEYDGDCEEYLQEYRRFLVESKLHAGYLARYRTVELEVENAGTQPASDITVIIDFPDEFHFPITHEEQEQLLLSREPPEAPVAPSIYKSSLLSYIGQSPAFLNSRLHDIFMPNVGADLGQSNVSGPFVKPKNSTEVTFEINQLVHNFIEALGPVGFYLTNATIGQALELTYSIHAAELMRPIEGSLIVAVELAQEG